MSLRWQLSVARKHLAAIKDPGKQYSDGGRTADA